MVYDQLRVPKAYIDLLDQMFEVERKLSAVTDPHTIHRNLNRMKEVMATIDNGAGLVYESPLGESFNETRSDVEASITGTSPDNLIITEVIKPIIRYRKGGLNFIARKGVVIARSTNE